MFSRLNCSYMDFKKIRRQPIKNIIKICIILSKLIERYTKGKKNVVSFSTSFVNHSFNGIRTMKHFRILSAPVQNVGVHPVYNFYTQSKASVVRCSTNPTWLQNGVSRNLTNHFK